MNTQDEIKYSLTMMRCLTTVFCFLMLTGVCAAQGYPEGTTRVSPSFNGSETYYGRRGEYLGRSTNNVQGGRTYSNTYDSSYRSTRTYNGGQRFQETTRSYRSNYGHFNAPSRGSRK
jgi:hypothetical protein